MVQQDQLLRDWIWVYGRPNHSPFQFHKYIYYIFCKQLRSFEDLSGNDIMPKLRDKMRRLAFRLSEDIILGCIYLHSNLLLMMFPVTNISDYIVFHGRFSTFNTFGILNSFFWYVCFCLSTDWLMTLCHQASRLENELGGAALGIQFWPIVIVMVCTSVFHYCHKD